MAKKVPLPSLGAELERRVAKKYRSIEAGGPRMNEALLRIGILIESHAKLNVRRHGAIDTGRLINSIRHEVYVQGSKAGVRVGSFGIPYAAMHEFGGPFTDRQRRAMFAALRDRGKLGGGEDKGVIQGNRWMARPYLRPAYTENLDRILEILRSAIA